MTYTEARDSRLTKLEADQLVGTWSVIELDQVGHTATPDEQAYFEDGGYKITFTDTEMIHSPDGIAMEYRLDINRNPKVLEYVEDGRVVARAIYRLDDATFEFVVGRQPQDGTHPNPPGSFAIADAASGTFPTRFVLKRQVDD